MSKKRKIVEHRHEHWHFDGAERERHKADEAFWCDFWGFIGAVLGAAIWVIPSAFVILEFIKWMVG